MLKRMRAGGMLLAAGLIAAAALPAAAAPAAPREYLVFKTDHPPAIDGDAREDIWRAASWSGDFVGPRGAQPDVETQFAMTWDEQFLYVAVRCKEPKPETIHAGITGNDPRIANDDHVEILLAPFETPAAGSPGPCLQVLLNPGLGRADQWLDKGRPARAPELESRRLLLEQAGFTSASRLHSSEWLIEAAIPLPKIGWPLKEGLTYSGNICRFRPGAPVKEMAWNLPPGADRGTMLDRARTPSSFGLFKLCGPAPKAPPIQNGDAVSLINGDLIKGRLLSLADGEIQFSSPAFAEAVSFSAAEVQRLDLAWTQTDAAPSQFYLNNGDRISGRIASLSAEAVGLESPALGRISFPRGLLSSIAAGGFSLDRRFESGRLGPWELIAGSCTFAKGALRLSGGIAAGLHPAVLALPVHQDRTVTFIADYNPSPPFTPLRIHLFADRSPAAGGQVQSSLMFEMTPAARFVVFADGQPISPPRPRQRAAPAPTERAQVKVTYSPAEGTAWAWYNGKEIAEMDVPGGPREGEYVLLAATRPISIHRLAVYCGLPAPDRPMAGPKPGELLTHLSNGDVLQASQVEFAGGDFVFTTEFGPMKVGPDRVIAIEFPAAAGKPPAASGNGGGAALLETGAGRFTLDLTAITDELVIGRSPDLGELKFPRRLVRSISFPAS